MLNYRGLFSNFFAISQTISISLILAISFGHVHGYLVKEAYASSHGVVEAAALFENKVFIHSSNLLVQLVIEPRPLCPADYLALPHLDRLAPLGLEELAGDFLGQVYRSGGEVRLRGKEGPFECSD